MTPDIDVAAELGSARAHLAQGRSAEAQTLAARLVDARPRLAAARLLLGQCESLAGDAQAAEASFKAGQKLERGDPDLAIALADLLAGEARDAEAERVLRAALGANRRSAPLAARLARALTAGGRAAEALTLTAALAGGTAPDHAALTEHAAALKALGRPEKALATYERAAALYPDDPVALHNLAAMRGDLGAFAAAAQTAARALRRSGEGAPQTWLVYARALLGERRLEEAEQAFRAAIARAPAYLEAHRELAQLVWMRTADAGAATVLLDAQIAKDADEPDLFSLRANLLSHAGDEANAYAGLRQGLRRHPDSALMHLRAAQIAAKLEGGAEHALRHAETASRLLPDSYDADTVLAASCLATGDAGRAAGIAAKLVQRRPFDQRALAYQATAWRLGGDPRYAALYDYGLVRAWRMDVPDGWATLEAYLADLAAALGGIHPFQTHPLDQSVRHGSQATHLLASEDPVIRAFRQAVDGPIRRHLAAIGQGHGPLRRRNAGGYRFQGMWSVRLRPGGFHTDHIHPEGWLSSACYVALPDIEGDGQEAWIKFGEPGIPTAPRLGPEHFVRPEPGMLVLFPSYMWHGTVPFTSGGTRLSVAFDLVPDKQGLLS